MDSFRRLANNMFERFWGTWVETWFAALFWGVFSFLGDLIQRGKRI